MKILYNVFLLLFLPIIGHLQEVTTLATLTANGGVTLDSVGNLYVAHFGPLPPNPAIGRNIYKVTPEGAVSLFVDDELRVGSGNSIAGGFLYQSNFAANVIYQIDLEGNIVNPNYATIAGPVGIATGNDSSLYVCSCVDGAVKKITPDGNVTDFATGSFFACANGITIDDDGNLYTTNFSDGRITKITASGNAETLGSTPVGNGHITYRAADQMLYIASYSGHQIFKMDLAGNATLFAGTGAVGAVDATNPLEATFNRPNGIELSPDGCSLYVTQDNDVIREIKFGDTACLSDVQSLDENPHLKLYPNPSTGKIIFENLGEVRITSISIFDVKGSVVMKMTSNRSGVIDVSTLSPGTYIVLMKDQAGGMYHKKMILE